MELRIGPVESGDHSEWVALFDGYAAFYKTDPAPARDTVWRWIMDPDEPFYAQIARDEAGRALGLVQYQLMHRSLSGGMVVYLSDLFTVPEARGLGVGRALIDHVRDFARARGNVSVRWLTHEGNLEARKLYDSYTPASGFILYAVTP